MKLRSPFVTSKKEEPKERFIVYNVEKAPGDKKTQGNGISGEPVKDENRFRKELGEEHPYEYKVVNQLTKKFGVANAFIDKIVNFVWGAGFQTKAKDPRDKEIIDDWMRDVDFANNGRKWVKQALRLGSSYMELGGDKLKEAPKAVKVWDANRMFIKRDNKGNIKKYNQVKGEKGRIASSKEKPISFKPFQMALLTINTSEESPYGLGIVYPNLIAINAFLKNAKDLHTVISRKANTPIVMKLGDKESGELPTQSEIDRAGNDLTFMNNKTEWTISADMDLSVLDFNDPGKNFEGVLKFDWQMILTGFQVPEVLAGAGSIPEGLAKVQMDDFERYARSIQRKIETIVEGQIFTRVLQANDRDGKVDFEWGQPSQDDLEKRIQDLTTLLANQSLNSKLRAQVEAQLAELLGIDPKSIELDDAERAKEEEENKQPIVPGQNEQTVKGRLVH